MHLIIDGYNVMRQSPRLQFLDVMDLQAGRENYQKKENLELETLKASPWQMKGGFQSKN